MRTIIRILPCVMVLLLLSCKGNSDVRDGKAVSVKVVEAAVDSTSGGVSYTGLIEESSGVALSFGSSGTIKSLAVDAGSRVAAGQEIGVLDGKVQGDMVETARSALSISQESLSQAEDMYNRMRELYEAGSLPEVQWIDVQTKVAQARESVKAAESQMRIAEKGMADCRLVAPFSGYISAKMVSVGENIVLGMPVVRLVNISRVKAKCSVPENEIENFKVGDVMQVCVSALGGAVFNGIVSEKDVSADALSRTYSVAVSLDNEGGTLLPGMLCNVIKEGKGDKENIVIPARVVQIDEANKPFVWVVKDSKAMKTYISTGANHGEMVVVSSGLAAGDKVISDGSQKVSDGMSVEIVK